MHCQTSKLDSITILLFTNSETAATTPLRHQKLWRGHCLFKTGFRWKMINRWYKYAGPLLQPSFYSVRNLFYLAGGSCWKLEAGCCPQPCFVFSFQSALYLAISSLMTRQPEGQGKGIQRRRGNPKRESKVDNKDRSVLRMRMSVRKAIHWV